MNVHGFPGPASPARIPAACTAWSKWNKVEHRLFSFIAANWRGKPLAGYATVVSLIARTTTAAGLEVSCSLALGQHPVGRRVSDEEWKKTDLVPDDFHGDWNCAIRPRRAKWVETFILSRTLT